MNSLVEMIVTRMEDEDGEKKQIVVAVYADGNRVPDWNISLAELEKWENRAKKAGLVKEVNLCSDPSIKVWCEHWK